jgi:ethanolamine utilization protein EutN
VLLGRVSGHATSTVKHKSLHSWRLVAVDPLLAGTTDPLLTIDALGSRVGDLVVITNDGKGARELVGDETSPARWTIIGIVDQATGVTL